MRLAIFSDTYAPQVNGVARTLARLVGAVRARGGDATVITVAASEADRSDGHLVRWPAVPFWAYDELSIAMPNVGEARRLLRELRPDLVHIATPFGIGLAARAAARTERVPIVSSFHTDFAAYLRYYRLQSLGGVAWPYLRWFHNGGTRTFAPTATGAETLRRRGFTGVRVWGRGVDRAQFSPAHRSRVLRSAFGIGDADVLVTYVGRLAPEKGIDTILEAARRVLPELGGRMRLAFVGDGPAERRCRSDAPVGTIFAGRLLGEALSEFYASSDIFIFASQTDTFGNVLLEAMASGLAVIAPDAGPTLEVAHEGNALLAAADDPGAYAAALQRLMGDASLRARLRTRALASAAARDWGRIWDDLFVEYATVVRGAAGVSVTRGPLTS